MQSPFDSPLSGFRSPFGYGRRLGGALAAYAVATFTPKLVFDFKTETYATGGAVSTFDDSITYTGDGLKTMVDSDGARKWAPHNLLTYSEDFANWTKYNALVLGNEETAPNGTLTADKIVENTEDTNHNVNFFNMTFSSSAEYTIKFYCKQPLGETRHAQIRVSGQGTEVAWATFDLSLGVVGNSGGSASPVTAIESASNGWFLCSISGVLFPNGGSTSGPSCVIVQNPSDVEIKPYEGDGVSGIYLWGAHVYRSDLGGMVNNPDRGDSYVPTTDSPVYLPRRGHHVYDGTSYVNEGLLVESEARTNLLTYSTPDAAIPTDWSTAVGSGSPSLVDLNNGLKGLEFTVNDDRLVLQQSVTASAAGEIYTLSLYFENTFGLPDATEILRVGGAAVDNAFVTIGDADEYDRVVLTFETTGSGDLRFQFGLGLTGNETGTIRSGGPQLEQAPTPSSYIPTSGAAITRAAETLTVPAAKLPYSSTNMLIQMEGRMTYADTDQNFDLNATGGEVNFVSWRLDNSNSVSLELRTAGGRTGEVGFLQDSAGTADFVVSEDIYSPGINVLYNIASRHGSTFVNGAVDGTALTVDTDPTALPDLSATDLKLAFKYMGTLRQFRMWDDDLGDSGIEEASE